MVPFAIGLPSFEKHILNRRTDAVDHKAFNADTLTFCVRSGDVPTQFLLVDFKSSSARSKADVNIGACGLRRGFFQIVQFLHHDQFPSRRFSNSVERRPRSTMSNL